MIRKRYLFEKVKKLIVKKDIRVEAMENGRMKTNLLIVRINRQGRRYVAFLFIRNRLKNNDRLLIALERSS